MKDIKNYEGLYAATEEGQIYSYRRKIFLKGTLSGEYPTVKLYKDGKGKTYFIHRLIAETFLDNPNNYQIVNHKNENKEDSSLNNLEWCDNKYNVNYGEAVEKRKSKASKKVRCVELDRVFDSQREAEKELGVNNISAVLHGKIKTTGGYHFERVE